MVVVVVVVCVFLERETYYLLDLRRRQKKNLSFKREAENAPSSNGVAKKKELKKKGSFV